jgi:hypothetical protein
VWAVHGTQQSKMHVFLDKLGHLKYSHQNLILLVSLEFERFVAIGGHQSMLCETDSNRLLLPDLLFCSRFQSGFGGVNELKTVLLVTV